MLKAGDPVPDFAFASETFGAISARALRGKRYILYFYPKDDTPGCTREACAFRDNLPKFAGAGLQVYGVSADDEKSHIRFSRKHMLPFKLIPDPDHAICERFGTWIEKSMYGRSYMGVARTTFVIAADGRIERVWERVAPDGHAEEVLAWLNGESQPNAAGVVRSKPATAARPGKATPAVGGLDTPPASKTPATALLAKTAARTSSATPAKPQPTIARQPAATVRSPANNRPAKVRTGSSGAKPAAKKTAAAKKSAPTASRKSTTKPATPATKKTPAAKPAKASKAPPAKPAIKAAKRKPTAPARKLSAAKKPRR